MDELIPLPDTGPTTALSERQAQCLSLAAQGMTSKEIARQIGVSPSTVDSHLRAAADRLQVRGRRDAVRTLKAVNISKNTESGPQNLPGLQLLPPLGGRPNELDKGDRFRQVILLAVLGTMALTAITFTISGLIHVLNLK